MLILVHYGYTHIEASLVYESNFGRSDSYLTSPSFANKTLVGNPYEGFVSFTVLLYSSCSTLYIPLVPPLPPLIYKNKTKNPH